MAIQWTSTRSDDPEATHAVYRQMIVDGKKVSAHFSAEARRDFGEAACMEMAVEKIEQILASGAAFPTVIPVRTSEFASS